MFAFQTQGLTNGEHPGSGFITTPHRRAEVAMRILGRHQQSNTVGEFQLQHGVVGELKRGQGGVCPPRCPIKGENLGLPTGNGFLAGDRTFNGEGDGVTHGGLRWDVGKIMTSHDDCLCCWLSRVGCDVGVDGEWRVLWLRSGALVAHRGHHHHCLPSLVIAEALLGPILGQGNGADPGEGEVFAHTPVDRQVPLVDIVIAVEVVRS